MGLTEASTLCAGFTAALFIYNHYSQFFEVCNIAEKLTKSNEFTKPIDYLII